MHIRQREAHSDFARLKMLIDELESHLFRRNPTKENVEIARNILIDQDNRQLLHPNFISKMFSRIEKINSR